MRDADGKLLPRFCYNSGYLEAMKQIVAEQLIGLNAEFYRAAMPGKPVQVAILQDARIYQSGTPRHGTLPPRSSTKQTALN